MGEHFISPQDVQATVDPSTGVLIGLQAAGIKNTILPAALDGSGNVIGLVGPTGATIPLSGPPIVVTASRDLANTDDGQVLVCTGASQINLTMQQNILNPGFICGIVQDGTGKVTTINGAGTTQVNVNIPQQFSTSAQNALIFVAQVSINKFNISGSTGL